MQGSFYGVFFDGARRESKFTFGFRENDCPGLNQSEMPRYKETLFPPALKRYEEV